MKDKKRYGIWLIDNIIFSGNDFEKQIDFDGQRINLLITNYENSQKLPEPFKDWIRNKIVNLGMINSANSALPLHSVYVLTTTPYLNQNTSNFSLLINLCLRLVYYPPTLVSHTAEYIPKAAITLPSWEGWKNVHPISKKEINKNTFDLVIDYFEILNSKKIKYHNTLEQIYKIANINDILDNLVSL